MAYVPHVRHDVFISYAHLDNLKAGEVRGGWVDSLVDPLTVQLKKRVGSDAVQIWMDHELAGNRPLTPEILTAVRESALLVVLLSPAYLRSEWCARERNAFLQVARDRVADGRVFVIKCLDIPRDDSPSEFGDLAGYTFFEKDRDSGASRSLGDPDPTEPGFYKQIFNLSVSLAKELTRLSSAGNPLASPQLGTTMDALSPLRSSGPRVFVARATDDLEDREDQVRNCLTQAGITVGLRRQYAQADKASFEAAVRADLDNCKLFVQLLSTARGSETSFDSTRRLPWLQNDVARRAGKKMLVWRDRGVNVADVVDPSHRELLESAIACPIEEFKRRVSDEALREPPATAPRPANVMVFVDIDFRDRALGQQVAEALAAQGIACYWPLEQGSPEEVRRDLEANLRDSDGVVIVYGSSEPIWVREQWRFGMKVFSQRQSRPALAICSGPPPSKSDLGLLDPDMLFLDCREGFKVGSLQPFIEKLR
jgi:hypothetical protein